MGAVCALCAGATEKFIEVSGAVILCDCLLCGSIATCVCDVCMKGEVERSEDERSKRMCFCGRMAKAMNSCDENLRSHPLMQGGYY